MMVFRWFMARNVAEQLRAVWFLEGCMYVFSVKTWADGRLTFLQVRRSGKVVFGVIFDASDAAELALVCGMLDAIASCFGLSVDEVRRAVQGCAR